jgi:hypothetical protein
MVKIEIEMNPSQFFEKSISTFKNNRTLQMCSVLILLLLISKPVYSMYVDFTTPANAHEKDNNYFLMQEDWGYVFWAEDSEVVLSNQETFSIILDGSELPIELESEVTIIGIAVNFYVADFNDDNEDTTGIGCLLNDGDDASDSISLLADHPSIESRDTASESGGDIYISIFEYPEVDTYPFITGYTVDEIYEMFDTEEYMEGEFSFNFTGIVESGESTTECERSDSSVTFDYSIILEYADIRVLEWNDDMVMPWF